MFFVFMKYCQIIDTSARTKIRGTNCNSGQVNYRSFVEIVVVITVIIVINVEISVGRIQQLLLLTISRHN